MMERENGNMLRRLPGRPRLKVDLSAKGEDRGDPRQE